MKNPDKEMDSNPNSKTHLYKLFLVGFVSAVVCAMRIWR